MKVWIIHWGYPENITYGISGVFKKKRIASLHYDLVEHDKTKTWYLTEHDVIGTEQENNNG